MAAEVGGTPRTEPTPADVALSAELDKLGPAKDSAPAKDTAPAAKKRSSGTSGAERRRRAQAESNGGTKPAAPRTRATPKPKIADGMAQLYVMVGMGLSMTPTGPAVAGPGKAAGMSISATVGSSLMAEAAGIGAAWEKAAADDPRVRDALQKLLTVSTFGQVIAAHLPVVLSGMVAAGAAPAALVGYVEPAEAP